jgi:hypothetical protein
VERTWLERTMRRGRGANYFPHQLWFIMDNPVRRLLVNPQQLVDRLELGGSEDVLEVGPGPGLFSVEIARRLTTGRLELFDLQPEMLDKARRKLDRAGCRNVGFHAGTLAGRFRSRPPLSTSPFSPRCLVRCRTSGLVSARCIKSCGLVACSWCRSSSPIRTACVCRRSVAWLSPRDFDSSSRGDAHGSTPSASGEERDYHETEDASMQDPDIVRASDSDREAAVERLRVAAAEGRLTLEELIARTEAATPPRPMASWPRSPPSFPCGRPARPPTRPSGRHRIVSVFGDLTRGGSWRAHEEKLADLGVRRHRRSICGTPPCPPTA